MLYDTAVMLTYLAIIIILLPLKYTNSLHIYIMYFIHMVQYILVTITVNVW